MIGLQLVHADPTLRNPALAGRGYNPFIFTDKEKEALRGWVICSRSLRTRLRSQVSQSRALSLCCGPRESSFPLFWALHLSLCQWPRQSGLLFPVAAGTSFHYMPQTRWAVLGREGHPQNGCAPLSFTVPHKLSGSQHRLSWGQSPRL